MGGAFALSDLARSVIGFATGLIVARGLGRQGFGEWALAMAWASTLTVVFDLGFGVLLVREAAQRTGEAHTLAAAAMGARLLLFLPVAGILLLGRGSVLIGFQGPAALPATIALAAAGLAYGSLAPVFRARPRSLVAILVVESGGAALQCAAALGVVVRGGGVLALLIVGTGVQIVQLTAAWMLWRMVVSRSRLRWPGAVAALRLLRAAVPFAMSGMVANAQARLAPLLLGGLAGVGEVATFGAAWRIGSVARILPQAGLSAALPVLSGEMGGGQPGPLRRRLDVSFAWFGIVAAAGLAALAAPIIDVAYGRAFAPAATALVWVAAGLPPWLANSSCKVFLYASGRETIALGWSAAALAIQTAGCLLLIPRFGGAGAAAALAIGEAAVWLPLRRAGRTRADAEYGRAAQGAASVS
jgi:O-antigen/teichoic acid export membrane protein